MSSLQCYHLNYAPHFQIIIIIQRQVHNQVHKYIWVRDYNVSSFLPSIVIFGWGAYAIKPCAKTGLAVQDYLVYTIILETSSHCQITCTHKKEKAVWQHETSNNPYSLQAFFLKIYRLTQKWALLLKPIWNMCINICLKDSDTTCN